jgi:hypothetical protein
MVHGHCSIREVRATQEHWGPHWQLLPHWQSWPHWHARALPVTLPVASWHVSAFIGH